MAASVCPERLNTPCSWASEGLGARVRVGQCLDGGGPVVCRHAGGTSFQFVDGDGEGGSQHRGVVLYLFGQVEFFASADGDGSAEHSPCMFQHEVYFFGSDQFRRDDEVALVFAVFVIHNDDKFSFLEVFYSFIDAVQLDFLLHIADVYFVSILYIIRCSLPIGQLLSSRRFG